VMLASEHISQALHLYEAGADLVYIPRLHSAPEIARMLRQGMMYGFEGAREAEIERLTHRNEVLA
jgi:hypothetical protein